MGRINVAYAIFEGPSGPNKCLPLDSNSNTGIVDEGLAALKCASFRFHWRQAATKRMVSYMQALYVAARTATGILAEGAIALSVTLSGGALFAS